MTQWFIRCVLVTAVCLISQARGDVSRGDRHFVIDGVKIPFGTEIEVSGPGLELGAFRRKCGVATIRGLRINGKANQDELEFHLFSPDAYDTPPYKELKSVKPDTYYKVRGRLMNGRTVGPRKEFTLIVDHIESMPAAPLRFADFVNREATFEGTAVPGGLLKTKVDEARIDKLSTWPKSVDGKQVSVRGTVRADQIGWRIENPSWKLVDLADQVGQNVSLDGVLWNRNGHWYFEYRSKKLFLTSALGPTMTFDQNDLGRRACVIGKLVRQDRLVLDQSDRGLVPCFVVRGAKVEYLEDQSTWGQKFIPVYSTFHSVRDGVPELLAERCFRGNDQFNRATAALYAWRNDDVIREILDEMSPEKLEILAKRMHDSKLPSPIRLLYATMLASANDERGRSFLIATIKDLNQESFADALFCLGEFPSLASKQTQKKTNVAWAEKTLIALMTDRRKVNVGIFYGLGNDKKFTVPIAEAVGIYSEIPRVLLRVNSAAARKVLVNYAVANHPDKSPCIPVIDVLLDSDVPIPVDDLMRLEPLTKGKPIRRNKILSQFLRQKHYAAAERFFDDLESGYVYNIFRDHTSAELTASLRPCIKRLKGKTKEKVQMLVVLGERDPVPALITMLDDSNWKNKYLVLYELAQLRDPRAVGPVARILHRAPRDYFNTDSSLINSAMITGRAVEQGLDVFPNVGTPEAIRELIELLPADLARFRTHFDQKEFQRIVAAHLIELTGESFGVDVHAWRAWQRTQPVEALKP